MSRRLLPLFVTTVALVLMTIPSWAMSDSRGTLSGTVDFSSAVTLSNTTLKPGEYKVVAEGSQARFERDGKTVAEVPCTLKTLSSKAAQTESLTNHDRLTEIQISGKTQAIEFPAGQNASD